MDLGAQPGAEIRGYRTAPGALGALAFHTRGQDNLSTERVRISDVGNVGIGTDNPESKLHVQQSAVDNAPSRTSALYLENDANCEIQMVGNPAKNVQLRMGTSNNSFEGALDYSLASNTLHIYTNSTKQVTIDDSGNVGIGGTLPSVPNISLNSDGTGTFNKFVKVQRAVTSDDQSLLVLVDGSTSQNKFIATRSGAYIGENITSSGGSVTDANITLNADGDGIFEGGLLANYVRSKRDLDSEQIPAFYAIDINSGSGKNIFHVGSSGINLGTDMTYGGGSVTNYNTRIGLDGSANFADTVSVGNTSPTADSGEGGANIYGGSGGLRLYRSFTQAPGATPAAIFDCYNNGNEVATIATDGSATFAGKLTAATFDLESLPELP